MFLTPPSLTQMLSTPHSIVQKQLSTAMGVISDNDFPDKWDTLLPEMIEKLATDDYDQINGVLRTLSAIIRKFRTAFASDIEDV